MEVSAMKKYMGMLVSNLHLGEEMALEVVFISILKVVIVTQIVSIGSNLE